MSKIHIALLTTLLLTAAVPAASASEVATSRNLGLGIILGLPTGPTLKYHFNQRHAFDLAVGFGFLGGNNISIHADYLFQFPLLKKRPFDFAFYMGIGGRVISWFDNKGKRYYGGSDADGRVGLAVRVPFGISFNLNKVPLEIFLELVPGVGFFPATGFAIDAALGVRYYF